MKTRLVQFALWVAVALLLLFSLLSEALNSILVAFVRLMRLISHGALIAGAGWLSWQYGILHEYAIELTAMVLHTLVHFALHIHDVRWKALLSIPAAGVLGIGTVVCWAHHLLPLWCVCMILATIHLDISHRFK